MIRFLKNGKDVVRTKEGILEIMPLTTHNGELTQIKLVDGSKIIVDDSFEDVVDAVYKNSGLVMTEVKNKPLKIYNN